MLPLTVPSAATLTPEIRRTHDRSPTDFSFLHSPFPDNCCLTPSPLSCPKSSIRLRDAADLTIGTTRRSQPSDSNTALVPQTLSPLSFLGLTWCSWLSDSLAAFVPLPSDSLAALDPQTFSLLSFLGLSRRYRPSDFLVTLVHQTFSPLGLALVPLTLLLLSSLVPLATLPVRPSYVNFTRKGQSKQPRIRTQR